MPRNCRSIVALGALLLFSSGPALGSPGGFNPRGRQKGPSTRSVPKLHARETGAKPSRAALILRYSKIVRDKPGAPFPLERLVDLTRQRDGHLNKLLKQIQKQVALGGRSGARAQLTLAGLFVHVGQGAKAGKLYRDILAVEPDNVLARTQWANLLAKQQQISEALTTLTPLLTAQLSRVARDEALQKLIRWSLDSDNLASAQKFHRQRVSLAGNSFFIESELGRLLMERRQFAEAESEYRKLLQKASGDTRTVMPALRNLGQALLAQNKYQRLLDTLSRAQYGNASQSSTVREIDAMITSASRALNRIPELIDSLEQSRRKDSDHWTHLAELYSETGQINKACGLYERVLRHNSRAINVRLPLIQLLQLKGDLGAALRHREQLVRLVPGNHQFALLLAQAYVQSGKRDLALNTLQRLRQRNPKDNELTSALVQAYREMGDNERALQILRQSAKSGAARPVIELGEHYFALGHTAQAVKTWQRLTLVGKPGTPSEAQALHRLGEVYLEHDLPEQAVAVLDRAHQLAPHIERYSRSLALAFEKSASNQSNPGLVQRHRLRAQQLWQSLQRNAYDARQSHRAREARQHIIGLWSNAKTLTSNVPGLELKFQASPPDLEAGRLLAEALNRQRRYAQAQKALEIILKYAPGDTPSRRELERVLVRQGHYEQAIEVLKRLAKMDPLRTREYFEKIASHAEKLYRDDLALEYSLRAVQLAPEDAKGHLRLGQMYRASRQPDRAQQQFRLSLRYNPRLFLAHFQLAELLNRQGKAEKADRHLRQIVRESVEPEEIARAARLCMQMQLQGERLHRLEGDLLPLALGNPQRPIYRRLLIEVYDALTRPLQQQVLSPDQPTAQAARRKLASIGQRAVKPLLDTLSDTESQQQQIALLLLSVLKNKDAAPALLRYAAGPASTTLRLQAMAAIATLQDPKMLSRLERFLWPADAAGGESEYDPVHLMAALSIARLATPGIRPALLRLVKETSPQLQTLGLLGLNYQYRRSDAAVLAALTNSTSHAELPRAAAAWVLAQHSDARALKGTTVLVNSRDSAIAGAALSALALVNAPKSHAPISRALLLGSTKRAEFAARAACQFPVKALPAEPLSVPTGPVNARQLLLDTLPPDCSGKAAARTLVHLAATLRNAAATLALNEPHLLPALASRLRDSLGRPSLRPLSEALNSLALTEQLPARDALAQLADRMLSPFLVLAQDPKPASRKSALRWLAGHGTKATDRALVIALTDRDLSVQKLALSLLAHFPSEQANVAVSKRMTDSASWKIRHQAARTLRANLAGVSPLPSTLEALAKVALADRYALVRNEAARTLNSLSPQAARSVLETLAQNDAEPEVRENARQLLEPSP